MNSNRALCPILPPSQSSRDPASLVKPLKTSNSSGPSPDAENQHNEKLVAAKSKAVRHLILVRHGQYNMDGATDAQRYLTEVGRQQAEYTGERLNALDIPWDRLIKSTMTRAQETGKIIGTKLDKLPPVEHCSLIEEGAPIAPEPPIGHWRPEPSVSHIDGPNAGHKSHAHVEHATHWIHAYASFFRIILPN